MMMRQNVDDPVAVAVMMLGLFVRFIE